METSVIVSQSAKVYRKCRIHVGAGYRVYYTRTGATVYFLLGGGSKSTQRKDIKHVKKLAREIKETKQ